MRAVDCIGLLGKLVRIETDELGLVTEVRDDGSLGTVVVQRYYEASGETFETRITRTSRLSISRPGQFE